MPALNLTARTRQEYLDNASALRKALAESSFAAKLQELRFPALAGLLEEAERDEYLAERLVPANFTKLARAARAVLLLEAQVDQLLALGFRRVVGVLEQVLAREKTVALTASLRLAQYVDLLEEAAQSSSFAVILQLYGFAEWVELLEQALISPDALGHLQRLDFFRLRRAVMVMLGLSRIAANREGLQPQTVLPHAPTAAPRPMSTEEHLEKDPFSFDFFWALRSLQVEHAEMPKLGTSTRIRDDFVRLRQEPEMRFASSTLRSFTLPGEGRAGVLSVNFLGLFGPNGALPSAITEYAIDRLRDRDHSIAHFADIFHHRLLSLFFRSWAVHQKAVDLDREEDRRFARFSASFCGLGLDSLQGRDAVPDLAKLYFSGRLALQSHHPEGLAAILQEFFGIPCDVENFHGHWITIPPDQVCRLGSSPDRCSLGTTAIVGSMVYQYQTKFRVRLGPMRYRDLQRLLPCYDSWRRLKAWVRNYIGDELLWDAQYILLASEVPPLQLGRGALLGWTTWLSTKPPLRDPDDVIIDSSLH